MGGELSENHLSNYMSCSAMEVLHVVCKEICKSPFSSLSGYPYPLLLKWAETQRQMALALILFQRRRRAWIPFKRKHMKTSQRTYERFKNRDSIQVVTSRNRMGMSAGEKWVSSLWECRLKKFDMNETLITEERNETTSSTFNFSNNWMKSRFHNFCKYQTATEVTFTIVINNTNTKDTRVLGKNSFNFNWTLSSLHKCGIQWRGSWDKE